MNMPSAARGLLVMALTLGAATAAETINPHPRALIRQDSLARWNFAKDAEGWHNPTNCTLSVADGLLRVQSNGEDPYLFGPPIHAKMPAAVKLRMRAKNAGGGAVYFVTRESPRWGEDKVAGFGIEHDGKWHEYEVQLDGTGTLAAIRLDPGNAAGTAEVDWIEITHASWHPIEIERVEATPQRITAHIRNHSDKAIPCTVNGSPSELPARQVKAVAMDVKGARPFEALAIEVRAKGLPPVKRTVFLHRPQAEAKWAVMKSGGLTLRVARDGSGARLERGGKLVAIVAPLVHVDGALPKLTLVEHAGVIRFRGDGIEVVLSMKGDEVAVSIESRRPCEGPVLRALGPLEQGLLAGLEYLGKGERSSSKLDIETLEHLRFAPDRLKVTMPLMAAVTDRVAAAMTWDDMTLQPVYAVPNFFDGTPDHRMALRGRKIEATLLVRDPQPLEELILWAVKRRGLPALPKPPRTRSEQWALCLEAIHGPISGEGGWGHCAGKRWKRHPYADHASTLWRLTGKAPELPKIVPGGAHVPNDAIYFVTGRAAEWLKMRGAQARGTMAAQKPDGSFRYRGKYQRGHFEDTASGHCAQPALTLLNYAWITGDKAALAAGLKTLEYMTRFRTPRGAQTWELSLHTPDILASARLVWAYVRGYELTGNADYLKQARRWALSGLPFVYQWSRHPVMLYATPPVFGATNWRGNWMGRPVQWCGGVYAYALVLLAPHDTTLDWRHLARGILISAEQQQYPDGPFIGCLPDVFELPSQSRRPANINPCALVSLRLVLDGQLDSLAVATDGKHRIAAPFPVEIRNGKARIQGKKGVAYQVLVDGTRILDVKSQGADAVPLD